ncbi:C40 family peptidase [Rhizobium sp. KVB221]|uniref:C40 family peptidase n=1 Tax=Rhizobium setariae TaxID=2801340 RepID=A0A936YIX7_9HYPH|nr:NlpC/P60 family protein [Rhizobium setariae]MBL0371080.1 C40 family peptidase [Rhizobium setariae]
MNEIVAIARSWIGTPYRHQGATRGVGCDCLGLIRGIWRQCYGREPEDPGPYGMDWAERSGEERLIEAARRHCGAEVSPSAMQAGDLILFRWREGMAAKHAGILSDATHFIHAYEQAGVIESALVTSWQRRIAAAFRFPVATA